MLKRSFLIFGLLVISVISGGAVQAQSTCKCEDSNGTAAASCPAGLVALCACSGASCNSRCVKPAPEAPKRLDLNSLVMTLKNAAPGEIGSVLSRSLGKIVTFETSVKNFAFDYPPSKVGASSHWDILEALAGKGNLSVSGHDIAFWKAQRDNLLRGGATTISTGGGTVQTVLNEISFVSGKRFSITSGNAAAAVTEPVKGNGLNELIQSLSKTGKVTIAEN